MWYNFSKVCTSPWQNKDCFKNGYLLTTIDNVVSQFFEKLFWFQSQTIENIAFYFVVKWFVFYQIIDIKTYIDAKFDKLYVPISYIYNVCIIKILKLSIVLKKFVYSYLLCIYLDTAK